MTSEQLLMRLEGVRSAGEGRWEARCPAHDDQRQSLSVASGEDRRVLLHCHAGCATEAVVQTLGLTMTDLMPAQAVSSGKPRIVATYDYCDDQGTLLYQAVRFDPKDFRQRRPDGHGNWIWKLDGIRRVPYKLPELLAADPGEIVFIPEGEKDVDNLRALGLVATCNVGGAGKWKRDYGQYFAGRRIVVLPDNDEPGRKHAADIVQHLTGVASEVRILALSDLPPKGDVSNWLARGGTRDSLLELLATTAETRVIGDIGDSPLDFGPITPLVEEPPPFPLSALPPVLANFVGELAEATQTPEDLAGLLVLAVCGAAIAKRIEVAVTGSWTEPSNIYVMIGLDPGNRKTAVFSKATAPLRHWERGENERLAEAIRSYQQRKRILEGRVRKLEEKAARETDSAKRRTAEVGAADAMNELANLQPVIGPRLLADDATPERITGIMLEQGGRLACMSPEGGLFDIMNGKYSKSSPNFDIFLKGHAGDDHRVDRVSRPSEFIEKPALTMAMCVQTDVIREVSSNKAFIGRGLTARFLYSVPVSTMGNRRVDTPDISYTTSENYQDLVQTLCMLKSNIDEDGNACAWKLSLSVGAAQQLKDFRLWIEPQLAPGDSLYDMQGWASKLPGAVVRIAAIIHAAQNCHEFQWWTLPISEDTISCAIEIGHFLLPHARASLAMMNCAPEIADANHVLAWIRRRERYEFTKREVYQATKNRFKEVQDLDRPLQILIDFGYLRPKKAEGKGPGRPASQAYQVNPDVIAVSQF